MIYLGVPSALGVNRVGAPTRDFDSLMYPFLRYLLIYSLSVLKLLSNILYNRQNSGSAPSLSLIS
jgi:hypothetical protein